ncbi:DUF4492 domain-containing protein [Marseilla massiliensis]|uniref:DUF4492 domain-containing protein n=2 Tax=Marseilla massiliensis TaxID=1841864 RepID=A0A938WS59_9BACT|nr:DUF4492 domain-containing protein [Marseilla massiliensis]
MGHDMIKRIINFYYEGFSNMRTGKTLWLVVIVKLVVIFLVLKLFFMPDILQERAGEGNEPDYIMQRLGDISGDTH